MKPNIENNIDRTEKILNNISSGQIYERKSALNKHSDKSYKALEEILVGWESQNIKLNDLKSQTQENFEDFSREMSRANEKLKAISKQISELRTLNLEAQSRIEYFQYYSNKVEGMFEQLKARFDLILYCIAFYFITVFMLIPLAKWVGGYVWTTAQTETAINRSVATNQQNTNHQINAIADNSNVVNKVNAVKKRRK